ncbi:MAG: TIGR00730 family Rossman fold protein [Candidatus Hydrogenedentes bacterium]|nr:TIGR00730 family Rossman fold protein [Candidatus Hydrogenedentota bacterium]
MEFLTSPDARNIRVLCEFVEPKSRFRRLRVKDTIVFFGSARTRSPEDAQAELARLEAEAGAAPDPEMDERLARARRDLRNSVYYRDAAELAERLTAWSESLPRKGHRFVICSGGGPGIMEAANRGAHQAGGRSVALNISLPFEQAGNPYQTPELAFEFHYFFVRKFWFVYLAKALIVFPGGFGTMDELFEVLTLVQTQKAVKVMPIVLYGSAFWKEIINFDALVEWGVISPQDVHLFEFCDSVDEAFDYLTTRLQEIYLDKHEGPPATA